MGFRRSEVRILSPRLVSPAAAIGCGRAVFVVVMKKVSVSARVSAFRRRLRVVLGVGIFLGIFLVWEHFWPDGWADALGFLLLGVGGSAVWGWFVEVGERRQ